MNNYFTEAQIYEIWIDLISYLTPKTSFLIHDLNYGFVNLICTSEGLIKNYENNENKLELSFSISNRRFICKIFDIKSSQRKKWEKQPPVFNINNTELSDLHKEIDCWLDFLQEELSNF